MRLMKRVPKRQGLWRLHCSELTVICGNCWTATDTTCTASYISAASVWNQSEITTMKRQQKTRDSPAVREGNKKLALLIMLKEEYDSLCSTVRRSLIAKSYVRCGRTFSSTFSLLNAGIRAPILALKEQRRTLVPLITQVTLIKQHVRGLYRSLYVCLIQISYFQEWRQSKVALAVKESTQPMEVMFFCFLVTD